MEENWDAYLVEINELPASFFLNLNAGPDGDVVERAYVCRVDVTLVTPDENGMVTNEELQALYAVEDSLGEAFATFQNGIFVGRAIHDGKCYLFFYLSNVDGVEKLLANCLANYKTYAWDYLAEHDPEWRHFFEFLYPDQLEMNARQNRRVLQVFEREGDLHHIPRQVSHWLYFPSLEALEHCKREVVARNFQVQEEFPESKRWKLLISREDSLVFEHINELTMELLQLAEQSDGEYDGWEAGVIRA